VEKVARKRRLPISKQEQDQDPEQPLHPLHRGHVQGPSQDKEVASAVETPALAQRYQEVQDRFSVEQILADQ